METQTPIQTPPTATTPEVEFIDIHQYLSEPTQQRAEVNETPTGTDGTTDIATDAPAPAPTEAVQFNETLLEVAQTTPLTTAITYDNTKLAETIVELADSVLTASAPLIYQSCLSKTERKNLKRLAARAKRDKNLALTEAEQDLLLINDDIDTYTEAMPLTTAEKNSIKQPLAEVLKTIDYQTSPQNALLLACGMVALPRVLPLIPMLFKPKN